MDTNKSKSSIEASGDLSDIPISIIEWLSDLYRLKGVPLEYIIPHHSLLPDESIRFFHIDENWIKAMFSGILSMGQNNDYLKEMEDKIWDLVHEKVKSEIIVQTVKDKNQKDRFLGSTNEWKLSGILLHSNLVDHFPGLEIDGYSERLEAESLDRKYNLPLIRKERLTPKIMLLIFLGEIKTIRINSPKESTAIRISDLDIAPSKRVLEGVLDFSQCKFKPVYASDFVSQFLHDSEFVVYNTAKNT